MKLLPWAVWLLLGGAAFLSGRGGCSGSSSHSLRYFSTVVSEPGHGLPEFITVGYLDDQPFVEYDSSIRREMPLVSWIRKVVEEDPQYWDKGTHTCQGVEAAFREDVEAVQNYYNQSRGFHTWQRIVGCELRDDGHKRVYERFGYDGKDHVSFDEEKLVWIAADAGAQMTKRKFDANLAFSQRRKDYLEKECIKWLQRYLDYSKEALQRTEPPVVQVTRKADSDGQETLFCQAHGFYPKEIDINWRKDGEVWQEGTFHGVVAPNSDGTYYTLLGIKIDPKDRDRYQCHVEHDSLTKPLDVAWKEPGSNTGIIIGCIVGAVLLLVALAVGFLVYIKKHQDGYKAASTSDGGSNISSQGSNLAI